MIRVLTEDGHCSASSNDSVEDIDLFRNIAADDESDFGIDNHDKSSTVWQVFGARVAVLPFAT
jgi:hypothetical protein